MVRLFSDPITIVKSQTRDLLPRIDQGKGLMRCLFFLPPPPKFLMRCLLITRGPISDKREYEKLQKITGHLKVSQLLDAQHQWFI